MTSRRPGATAFAISAAVHAVLLVPLVVLARPPEPIEFETIRVTLVAEPPADVVEEDRAPAPAPEPEPEPVRPEPEPEPIEEEPEPEPEPEGGAAGAGDAAGDAAGPGARR